MRAGWGLALLLAAGWAVAEEPAEAATDEAAVVPVAALPVPFDPSPGEVPFSEPMAPVPQGPPAWELAAQMAIGLSDPFYSKAATFLSARRRVAAWQRAGVLSIEAFGGRAVSWAGPALDVCSGGAACSPPSSEQLASTPGRLDWMGGAAAVWRPAQGKLSFGGLRPVNFALDLSGGVAVIGYRIFDGAEQSRFGPGVRLGFGLGADLTESFSARLDLQRFAYLGSQRGNSTIENQTMLGASFAWRPGSRR